MTVPVSLETNLLYVCGNLTHALHRAMTATFRKNRIKLTVEQFAVLALLFYQDGISQKEIAMKLDRDKTTIARVISNMERSKMIARSRDDVDTRGKLVFLTTKGKALQQRAVEHAGLIYSHAMRGIGRNASADAIGTLTRIIKNIHESS